MPSSRLRAGPCNVAINSFINCDDYDDASDDDASDDDYRERRKRIPSFCGFLKVKMGTGLHV